GSLVAGTSSGASSAILVGSGFAATRFPAFVCSEFEPAGPSPAVCAFESDEPKYSTPPNRTSTKTKIMSTYWNLFRIFHPAGTLVHTDDLQIIGSQRLSANRSSRRSSTPRDAEPSAMPNTPAVPPPPTPTNYTPPRYTQEKASV